MTEDLFSAAASVKLKTMAPLAARLRPRTLDDIVGQQHLLGANGSLRKLVVADKLSSVLLWGPAGTGKTTLAKVVARSSQKYFEQLSAVNASVKDVRAVLSAAKERLGSQGSGTILFLDEIHRFSKSQQDALLPGVEDGVITLIGATTENPFFEVNAPLRSRSILFRLHPLSEEDLLVLLGRGLALEEAVADGDALQHLSSRANGDGRQALTSLETALAVAASEVEDAAVESVRVRLEHAEAATDLKALRYGQDEHYDITSAFIKSIRGSDPDAGLYWLARMLAAGEDARFIARRLVISASEDIGMADPQSLLLATAAAQAVSFVGLPEAGITLAHVVVHLAMAPKSNAAYKGLRSAQQDASDHAVGEVPTHLRDAHYKGAVSIGHGKGYKYPHDYADASVEQSYLPAELEGRKYYVATDRDVWQDDEV